MLDKTKDVAAEITEKELGLGIQYARQIGNGQITMTAGVPLDYTSEHLNRLLDRMAMAIDRQAAKGTLEQLRTTLERAKADYLTTQQQLANHEASVAAAWEKNPNRRGDVKWTESQLKEKLNWQKNEQVLADRIRQFEAEIKDAEEKCR